MSNAYVANAVFGVCTGAAAVVVMFLYRQCRTRQRITSSRVISSLSLLGNSDDKTVTIRYDFEETHLSRTIREHHRTVKN